MLDEERLVQLRSSLAADDAVSPPVCSGPPGTEGKETCHALVGPCRKMS